MEYENYSDYIVLSFNDKEIEELQNHPESLALLEKCKADETEIKIKIIELLKNSADIHSKQELCSYYELLVSTDKKLYKFRNDEDYNISALKNNMLWFSRATEEDDKTECQPLIKETESQRNKFYDILCQYNPKFKEEKYKNAILDVENSFQPSAYICSLTEEINNADLWNRYANEKKGFCIEYKFKDFVEQSLCPLPVIYNKKEMSIMDFFIKVNPSLIFDTILTKEDDKWGTQNEWRLFQWAKTLNVDRETKGVLCTAPKPSAIYYTAYTNEHILSELKQYAQSNDIPILLYSDFE